MASKKHAQLSFQCVTSGSISQSDERFGVNRNSQCVCIAVTACVYIHNFSRDLFTSSIIDKIIEIGNTYYTKTKQKLGPSHVHAYLNPDEVLPVLVFENKEFRVQTSWVFSESYPVSNMMFSQSVSKLEHRLKELFEEDPDSCFVFLGMSKAVSLWMSGDKYFVFNSHSVDTNNNDTFNGVGRLFKCADLYTLSFYLLKNSPVNNVHSEYELTRVISLPNPVSINVPLHMNPVVVLRDIVKYPPSNHDMPGTIEIQLESLAVPSKRTSKVGRPVKKICGRPEISSPNEKEQHRKAVNKYTINNPEMNLKAVDKYTKESPGINRKAVEKYTKDHRNVNSKATKKHKNVNPGRHLPIELRKGGVIAEYSGAKLNCLKGHKLRCSSLMSASCYKCSHCQARLFDEEKQNRQKWCCGKGLYNVLHLPLLTNSLYEDKHFLAHSRMYNDLFAFSALDVPGNYHHPKGLSFLKILGRVYHKIYDLSHKGQKNTGRLYIDDGEARVMLAEQQKLDVQLINRIKVFLESCNPYIPLYKQLYNEPADEAHIIFKTTSRRIDGPVLGDRPLTTEVAAVISCENENYEPNRICIWKKGATTPHFLNRGSSLVEPFQYPLLYPQGTLGWEINRSDNKGKKLSLLKYTRCLLLSESRFSQFGRLSETWLVDMFARIDEERLQFLRYSQLNRIKGGLRTATLEEVSSTCNNKDTCEDMSTIRDIRVDETVQGDGGIVPGRVYLPSSYTGGPRYMKVAYMDAMALVSRFGTPTYFLTFTACGNWSEIKESKNPNSKQEAHLVNRVFRLKFLELINDIRCGNFFGKLTYIVWVIEFQMRGLPHAHIYFRVDNGGPVQGTDIDRVIRADIPNTEEADGRLRQLVLKHMTHGPCGLGRRTDLPCWDPDLQKCTKFFPKHHNESTYIDDLGFVHYKRNSDNKADIPFKTAREGVVTIDDTWVVPYNAPLLLKYECHINLEIASARRVVKYLFKYISKGPPLRRVAIVEGVDKTDEVEEYVTKRYIGATDAAWRIMEFPITGRTPTVNTLPVHLQDKQSVIFRSGKEKEAVKKSSSRLLLYFDRPRSAEMDSLTYLDFYERYIVHTTRPKTSNVPVFQHPDKVHYVFQRQRGECVARMFWVAPSRGEQYFLRMLLAKYPCRGYSDLYGLGGHDCNTFQQAARTLGLADDRNEYSEALIEASQFMKASTLRHFFVLLIQTGCPAPDMWDEFKINFCEDFLEQFSGDKEKAFKLALIQIGRCLRRQGSTLIEVGLPNVQDDSTELGRERLTYSSLVERKFVDIWEPRLSSDQLTVFDYLKDLLRNDNASPSESKLLFLDGRAGMGKTLLLKVIAAYFRSLDKVVLCVASSGIAALNLRGGATAHSMFKLPLDVHDDTFRLVTNLSQRAELIREASLVIFDEAPMAHKQIIETLDRSMRDLLQKDDPFGGKIILFAGDFRQIPPVVEKAKTPSEVVNCSLRKSYLWKEIKTFILTTSHRVTGDNSYNHSLLQLGSNMIRQHAVGKDGNTELLIPLSMLLYVPTIEDLIEFVFPVENLCKPDECASRAILCTLNVNVKQVNNIVNNLLEAELHNLYSVDSVVDEEEIGYEIDESLLHHTEAKGVPDHVLQLKAGSVCLVMRNLNFDLGLVNGTKVIVVSVTHRLVTCRRPQSAELLGIPRISFKFSIGVNSPIEMIRKQFPLQLAYAMTVHKSQGQTLDYVGLDLRTDCFTHGQLYVALSRVRSPSNIRVLVPPNRIIDEIPYTKNTVYTGLL